MTATPLPAREAPALAFHAEEIRSALQDRLIGGLVDLHARSWLVVLLTAGEVTLLGTGPERRLAGPALIWTPWERAARLRVRAGSSGGWLVMCETTLANAIGQKPEAADLRVLSARLLHMPLSGRREALADAARCFDLILRETRAAAPGAETVIEAQVRVLLVTLWRHAGGPEALAAAPAGASQILLRFRQLVEIHFRDRWTVARYAAELGVSPDRLHAITTRALGRPPLRLVHERLGHEATMLLERSSQSLAQVAGHLGFRSAEHFSAFFKALFGMPPGAWRRAARSKRADRAEPAGPHLADWP